MGYSKWSSDAYAHLRADYSGRSRDDIFRQARTRMIAAEMDPSGLSFRESRDSAAHPNSLAIAVFLDVTGSMGVIPELLIRDKLGNLMDTLIDHGVEDPQVMFSAVGDHLSDQYPLQVGQFESGTDEINNCLSSIFIEGGGGGTSQESYLLAWHIAGKHTSIDCFEKRKTKGFLFTIGDEQSWGHLDAGVLSALMGYDQAFSITVAGALAEAQKMYHVFHIHVNETGYRNHPEVLGFWRNLLGQRLLILDDHTLLAELIASTVAVVNGARLDEVAAGFDARTAAGVRKALGQSAVG